MRGQRNAIGSFPEIIDLDPGSVSNNTNMSQHTSLNNMLNPVESRLSNCTVSSTEAHCADAVQQHHVQGYGSWTPGESSSRMNMQNNVNNDGTRLEHGRSSSLNICDGPVPMSEERCFEPSNNLFPGRGLSGNLTRGGAPFLQGSSSSRVPQNVNLNVGYAGSSSTGGIGMEAALGSSVYTPSGVEEAHVFLAGTSSDHVGTSSGSSGYMMDENNGSSGSTLGGWGLSCKRKALEGTSGQSYPGGSSSSLSHTESSAWTGPSRNNASSSLSLSTPSWNSSSISPVEQLNPRVGNDVGGAISDGFLSSSIGGSSEGTPRNFGRRHSGHQQESLSFNLSSNGGSRHFNVWSSHQSQRAVSIGDPPDLRPTASRASNSSASQSRSRGLTRNMLPLPWNGAHNSRAGNFSGSLISGERGVVLQDEGFTRRIQRNDTEHSLFGPTTEARNIAQDAASWSLAPGNLNTSGPLPSSTRTGASSSSHPLPSPTWLPHPTSSGHGQQRPWSLFPSYDTDSGGPAGQFPTFSSGPSASSQEAIISSGPSSQSHHQLYSRSGLFMERQGDDVLGMPHSLRALAADIEGRHRLISEIRQVLNAMRRGENLRIEDYMLFDPFIYHGMAEMHDRHRDMRLDVDNMSYEELLALEERIGDVSTGMSEEVILKLMKQKKYRSMTMESSPDHEPCCICQEEYLDGEDVGTLDCGHDFHSGCIKQWLAKKNLCPICKTTGLAT